MNQNSPSTFTNFSIGENSRALAYSYQDDYDHPLFCVKCERSEAVQTRNFTYSHIPVYVYLICVLNLFIGLIVIALSAGQHRIQVPFCLTCWRRYRVASTLAALSILLFFASIVGGVAMMLTLETGYAFFPLPLLAITAVAGLAMLKRKSGPRIERSDKHEVVVDAGQYGFITFSKTTVAKFSPSV